MKKTFKLRKKKKIYYRERTIFKKHWIWSLHVVVVVLQRARKKSTISSNTSAEPLFCSTMSIVLWIVLTAVAVNGNIVFIYMWHNHQYIITCQMRMTKHFPSKNLFMWKTLLPSICSSVNLEAWKQWKQMKVIIKILNHPQNSSELTTKLDAVAVTQHHH